MLPVIAIVGRPNVGKSTLFNRLIGYRKAIVDDRPGVTRDRNYGETVFLDQKCIFVDTGGFEPDPDTNLFMEMRRQALIAIAEADIFLFVVDRKSGLTHVDELTVDLLRRSLTEEEQKKMLLVVNKCDGPSHDLEAMEFYALGCGDPLCISAEHNRGIYELWEQMLALIPEHMRHKDTDLNIEDDGWLEDHDHEVAALEKAYYQDEYELDSDDSDDNEGVEYTENTENTEAHTEQVAYSDTEYDSDAYDYDAEEEHPTDQVLDGDFAQWHQMNSTDDVETEVSRPEEKPPEIRVAILGRPNIGKSTLVNRLIGQDRHVVCDMPGTTMDSIDSVVEIDGQRYCFVDTAGIRRRSKINEKIEGIAVGYAIKTIEQCHICILLLDGSDTVSKQDARLAALIADRGRGCIVLINKWDIVNNMEDRNSAVVEDELEQSLPHISWAPVSYISALTGKGCHRIIPLIKETYAQFNQRISTSKLNRTFAEIVAQNPPPQKHHHRVRLNYVTQARVRPPTFVVWANSPEAIPESYNRYLENQMRKVFGYKGSPLRIHFRQKRKQWEELNG